MMVDEVVGIEGGMWTTANVTIKSNFGTSLSLMSNFTESVCYWKFALMHWGASGLKVFVPNAMAIDNPQWATFLPVA